MHCMVSVISFWKNFFFKCRKRTLWLWKNIVRLYEGFYPSSLTVPYLCQSYFWSSELKFVFICWGLMSYVPTQRYWGNQKYHGWFVNNKLSIYFGKDKTKLIVLISQHKIKNTKKRNIKYKEIEIKQYS